MNRAIINFEHKTLDTIHEYSLELLRDTGIKFPCEKALEIFKNHGFRTDGDMVFFKEKDVQKALETIPSAFTIRLDPEKNIRIGGNNYVMAPGYGRRSSSRLQEKNGMPPSGTCKISANWFKPRSIWTSTALLWCSLTTFLRQRPIWTSCWPPCF